MPESPADTMRRAAGTARELTRLLRAEMERNPYWSPGGAQGAEDARYSLGVENAMGGPGGEYAASFTPRFGDALAALFRAIADDAHESRDEPACSLCTAALAAARAYLGEEATDG